MPRRIRTRLLRLPQVEARTGLSRQDIYRRIIAIPPRFPMPVKCGRSNHFAEHEVDAWIAEQLERRDAKLAAAKAQGSNHGSQVDDEPAITTGPASDISGGAP